MADDGIFDRMRRDWDARATEDAKFYVTCERRNQSDVEFEAGAADVLARVRRDYGMLPPASRRERRFFEIGCGIGRLMRPLSGDCGEIHGLDISPEMIRLGRMRMADIHHAHFHWAERCDLSQFADSSFDLGYSFAVFQHIPGKEIVFRYLAEAYRVLKPGGLFVAQFSCTRPVVNQCDTWTGVWFDEAELLDHADSLKWQILAVDGAQTQYVWLTLKKTILGGGQFAVRRGFSPSTTTVDRLN